MPTLDNGGWVPDDHPLWLQQQQQKAPATGGAYVDPQSNPDPSPWANEQQSGPYVPQGGTGMGTAAAGTLTNYQTMLDPNATASASMPSTTEYQAQPPGVTAAGPDYASAYKTAFGSDATQEQLDWFNTQDPTAMMAHIQGMGAQQQQKAQPPGVTDSTAPAADMTPAQAAAAGLGWVPKDHPSYGTPGFVGSTGGAAGTPGAGGPGTTAPGATPGASNVDTQNTNAQTYSQTPGAPPSNATTNQGTQDVVRNTYLQSIQKGTKVDPNDPNFRQQADAFAAAQERARRNQIDDAGEAAFASGARGAGGNLVEQRMINEGAARNQGAFEGELVGRELQSRRDEIKNALGSLGGMIDNDQKLALQRELAALDAALKREGISSQNALGMSDLSLRDKLGTGALNVDLLRALLQNQQHGTDAGIRIGESEAEHYRRMLGI